MLNQQSVLFRIDFRIVFKLLCWKKISDDLGIYFDEEMNESLKGIDGINSLELIIKGSGNILTSENFNKKFSEVKNNEFL